MKIYTIRDKKMGTHLPPAIVQHLVEIQRSLQQVIQDGKSVIAKFPTDYELYFIGEFDPETGKLKAEKDPQFILNVSDLQENK